jgi:hypothetical protein
MKRRYNLLNYTAALATSLLLLTACEKEDYELPKADDKLQNDAIKRTLGPNIVGQRIEFVYALAIVPDKGKVKSAAVEASIAGASGTFLEHRSFYTSSGGADVPVVVGDPSTTTGAVTSVNITKDTAAVALRYYYVIPEEARGKEVSFTFTGTSTNGETVTYKLGPYKIATMDMKRLITVSSTTPYFSIADMTAYNAADAATNAGKIDLVYLYRNITTSAFNHAMVAPAADPVYLPGITLPAGVNRTAKIQKQFNLPDYNLAQTAVGVYIDDLDFEKLDLSTAPNYAINLKAEAGIWVETADGKYKAYIYFNSVNNTAGSAVVSIKRWAVPGK